MINLTREQRKSLKEIFDRCPLDANHDRIQEGYNDKLTPITYRQFRRTVQPVFFDTAVMVHWCGMWVGIEPDGYAHT